MSKNLNGYLTNLANKEIWDKNFVKTVHEKNPQVFTRSDDGDLKAATPLNDDPDIMEYGAVLDVLKNGYLNKNYKLFKVDSKEAKCFVTKEYLKIYDVVLFLSASWEEPVLFGVFLGEIDHKLLFKYIDYKNDLVREFKMNIYDTEEHK